MLVAMVLFAQESADTQRDLPVPPLVYGLVAFGIILVLLAVTFAFRSVGKRH